MRLMEWIKNLQDRTEQKLKIEIDSPGECQ